MSTTMRTTSMTGTAVKAAAVRALVCALAMFATGASAQVSQAGTQTAPHRLIITILEGEGAMNNIRQRDAREPVVQVTDENHKPVAGAAVLFLIHSGPSGGTASFSGSSLSLSVTTAADGTAHATGLQVANSPGSFTISVSASFGAVVAADVVIHQGNVISALSSTAGTAAKHGFHLGKGVIISSGVVVGTAVGIVVATHQSSSTTLGLGGARIGP